MPLNDMLAVGHVVAFLSHALSLPVASSMWVFIILPSPLELPDLNATHFILSARNLPHDTLEHTALPGSPPSKPKNQRCFTGGESHLLPCAGTTGATGREREQRSLR